MFAGAGDKCKLKMTARLAAGSQSGVGNVTRGAGDDVDGRIKIFAEDEYYRPRVKSQCLDVFRHARDKPSIER